MISVVLDTNVVVSAHLNPEGSESLVFLLALAGKLRLYLSEPIVAEYEAVLSRKKFSFRPERVANSLAAIRAAGRMVKPTHTLSICPDPDDNRFLECAEAAQADYLVTGNKRHFPGQWAKTTVVNGRALLALIVPDLQR